MEYLVKVKLEATGILEGTILTNMPSNDNN